MTLFLGRVIYPRINKGKGSKKLTQISENKTKDADFSLVGGELKSKTRENRVETPKEQA